MPGGAEVLRAERQAAREAGIAPIPENADQGRAIVTSAAAGTIVFALATGVAVVVRPARIPVAVIDLALFLAGSGLYLWGWGVAAGRSRDNEINLWNLILLEDVAPRPVRIRLLGALVVQAVVAAATCWISAPLAFGWLVPVFGLAHCEFWGARYGVFRPRRRPDPAPRRRQ